MRTVVHYDSAGAIHSFVSIDAPEEVRAMMEPEPGLSMAEIEGLELSAAAQDRDLEKVREIMKTHRVSTRSAPRATLTKAK
jgi:hypothetical protein